MELAVEAYSWMNDIGKHGEMNRERIRDEREERCVDGRQKCSLVISVSFQQAFVWYVTANFQSTCIHPLTGFPSV